MTPPDPPRLRVIFARAAPFAMILCRIRQHDVCSIEWNLKNDSFEIGQWIRAKIHAGSYGLTPDGKHFIYSGYRPWMWNKGISNWITISRTPYLKAIGFWECDYSGGNGYFIDDENFLLDGYNLTPLQKPSRLREWSPPPHLSYDEREEMIRARLRSCAGEYWQYIGHSPKSDIRPKANIYEQKVPNGRSLRHYVYQSDKPTPSLGTRDGDYELIDDPSGELIAGRGWAWANMYRDRLLWAEDGRLFAAKPGFVELENVRMLKDFNGMQFERIVAPY